MMCVGIIGMDGGGRRPRGVDRVLICSNDPLLAGCGIERDRSSQFLRENSTLKERRRGGWRLAGEELAGGGIIRQAAA